MAYLSSRWTLPEAACWQAFRRPCMLKAWRCYVKPEEAGDHNKRAIIAAAEIVMEAVISGSLRIWVRSVETGKSQELKARDLVDLELHIADYIPGSPLGFRRRRDGIIRWTDPVLAASEVLRYWPANKA